MRRGLNVLRAVQRLIDLWNGPVDVYVSSAALDRIQDIGRAEYAEWVRVAGPEKGYPSLAWPVKR